jgi:hypothetical protein
MVSHRCLGSGIRLELPFHGNAEATGYAERGCQARMATIRQRGAKWRVQIRRISSDRFRTSCANKEALMCLNPLKDKCTYSYYAEYR